MEVGMKRSFFSLGSGIATRAFVLAAALSLGVALQAGAQQITRVAVLDLSRVLAAFPQDAAAIKNFETRKAEVQAAVDAGTAEIKKLQAKKAEAEGSGESETARSLDQEITRKTAELREYAAARQNELELMAKALSSNASFLKKLNAKISQVAEAEGYALVLNTKPDQGPGIVLWNSSAVDITDKVIQSLNADR
jgi:outer membrane protein